MTDETDDLNQTIAHGLMQVIENMEPAVEAVVGFKADLLKRGLSEVVADSAAGTLLICMMKKMFE